MWVRRVCVRIYLTPEQFKIIKVNLKMAVIINYNILYCLIYCIMVKLLDLLKFYLTGIRIIRINNLKQRFGNSSLDLRSKTLKGRQRSMCPTFFVYSVLKLLLTKALCVMMLAMTKTKYRPKAPNTNTSLLSSSIIYKIT